MIGKNGKFYINKFAKINPDATIHGQIRGYATDENGEVIIEDGKVKMVDLVNTKDQPILLENNELGYVREVKGLVINDNSDNMTLITIPIFKSKELLDEYIANNTDGDLTGNMVVYYPDDATVPSLVVVNGTSPLDISEDMTKSHVCKLIPNSDNELTYTLSNNTIRDGNSYIVTKITISFIIPPEILLTEGDQGIRTQYLYINNKDENILTRCIDDYMINFGKETSIILREYNGPIDIYIGDSDGNKMKFDKGSIIVYIEYQQC